MCTTNPAIQATIGVVNLGSIVSNQGSGSKSSSSSNCNVVLSSLLRLVQQASLIGSFYVSPVDEEYVEKYNKKYRTFLKVPGCIWGGERANNCCCICTSATEVNRKKGMTLSWQKHGGIDRASGPECWNATSQVSSWFFALGACTGFSWMSLESSLGPQIQNRHQVFKFMENYKFLVPPNPNPHS